MNTRRWLTGWPWLMAAILAGVLAALLTHWAMPWLPSNPVSDWVTDQRLQAGAPPAPAGIRIARRGEPLPPLPMHDLHGSVVDAAQVQAGEPRLLVLWATWCAPCVAEWPALVRAQQQRRSGQPHILVLALDTPDAVAAFLARHPAPFPVLVDSAGPADVGVRLGNPRGLLPFSVLVDGEGRLQQRTLGVFRSFPNNS